MMNCSIEMCYPCCFKQAEPKKEIDFSKLKEDVARLMRDEESAKKEMVNIDTETAQQSEEVLKVMDAFAKLEQDL